MPDPNRLARLPQIALHQLARAIDRALKGATDEEPGSDLAHVVIEDRLAARIAKLGRHLPQAKRLDRRIRTQLLTDPVAKRVKLRRRRQPRIPRRRLGRHRPPNRLAMKPRPPADLPDRQPLDPVHAPDLRPLLHPDHTPPPRPSQCSSEGPNPAGHTRPRARRVTFRPAQVGQYSGGAHSTCPLATLALRR